jgi:hypothetical protein
MRRNSLTEKSLLVTDEREFVAERQRLCESIDRRPWHMHKTSALFFRAADSRGMGDVDVSAFGPSSASIWCLALAPMRFEEYGRVARDLNDFEVTGAPVFDF